MHSEHIDTPLKVLTWLALHAENVIWHQKRLGHPERVHLRFVNPNTNESATAKGFSITEAVALAQKMIDASAGVQHAASV